MHVSMRLVWYKFVYLFVHFNAVSSWNEQQKQQYTNEPCSFWGNDLSFWKITWLLQQMYIGCMLVLGFGVGVLHTKNGFKI